MMVDEIERTREEIKASIADPWGIGRRVSKAAALISALADTFPEMLKSDPKFAAVCMAAFNVLELETDVQKHFAMGAAVDLIQCSRAGTRGEMVQ